VRNNQTQNINFLVFYMLEGLRNILVVNGAVVWMGVGVDSRVVMTGDIFHLSTALFVWQVVQLLLVVGLG
jgi:hypothetical protein